MNSSLINLVVLLIIATTSVHAVDNVEEEVVETEEADVPVFANYGEKCTKITDCDSGAYLTCINGSCQCAGGDTMKFDDASSSCWVLPGEKCIYRASQLGIGSLLADIAGVEERTAHLADRVSFRCVSNAACEVGYCTCDSGYFATGNRTCERQRDKGEPCDSDAACRQSLHLICDDNICGCNRTNSIFDLEHGLCVGLSGFSCFDFELCAPNAICPSLGIFHHDVKCICKPGYFESAIRSCDPKQGYGAGCLSDDECRDDLNLMCIEGHPNMCACNQSTHIYDYTEGKCVALVGSPCSDASPCVPNADCQHAGFLNGNLISRSMTCSCSYGFFEKAGKCERKRDFEGECEDDSHCREDLKLVCNTGTGLCSCNETIQTYDRSRRRCIALAGTHCERNDNCVINSVCRSPGYLYPRHTPKADCICKDGFHKTVDGFCLGKYGSRCESWTNSCKDTLTCRNMECTCKLPYHQQYYDYSQGKCLTYVGVPCDGTNETTCIQHAFCGENPGGSEPVCRCYDGFVSMDGGRMCLALAGQKCSEGEDQLYMPCIPHARCTAGFCECANGYYKNQNDTCDKKKSYGEFCTSSESCEDTYCDKMGSYCSCNSSTSLFDPTRKTCMRLAGAKCYDMRDCVPNALCKTPGRPLNTLDMDATCMCKEVSPIPSVGIQYIGCIMSQGYTNSTDGRCIIDVYGGKCDISTGQLCSSKFICEEGICKCPYEDHQKYNSKQKLCISLVKGPCDNTTNNCIKNSHCIVTEEGVSECRCKHGFIPVDRGCELTFGQPCTSQLRSQKRSLRLCISDGYGGRRSDISNNLDENQTHCDRLAPLKCVHGTCQCGGFQYYDYELQKCRGLVGSRCSPEDSGFCSEGATCEVFRGLPEMGEGGGTPPTKKRYGRCKCKTGFAMEADRSCKQIILT